MSKRTEREFVLDIQEAIVRILAYAENMDYNQFSHDIKTQDAIIRNIEIIGEAVKNLSNNFTEQNPEIPWRNMAGIRDVLIHDYFGVNIDIVWDVVSSELPKLKEQIEFILSD